MKCPSWLLKKIFPYLSNRSMVATFDGSTARPQSLPAGGPQGTLLGVIIFIVKINGAFLRPPIPRNIKSECISVKYVDDATSASSVNLKKSLKKDLIARPRPLNYNEQCELVLLIEKKELQV